MGANAATLRSEWNFAAQKAGSVSGARTLSAKIDRCLFLGRVKPSVRKRCVSEHADFGYTIFQSGADPVGAGYIHVALSGLEFLTFRIIKSHPYMAKI